MVGARLQTARPGTAFDQNRSVVQKPPTRPKIHRTSQENASADITASFHQAWLSASFLYLGIRRRWWRTTLEFILDGALLQRSTHISRLCGRKQPGHDCATNVRRES